MINKETLSNGICIEYLDQGEGEVMLLLHGLGSTKADWDYQKEAFSEAFRMIAPDLRGHGNSSKPVSKMEYGISQCTEDMRLLLQALNIEKCTVIGFSMGGAIAFDMAMKYPKLIDKMIIVNSAPDFNNLGWFGKKMILERTLFLKLRGMVPLARKVTNAMFPEPGQIELRDAFYARASKNDLKAYYYSFRTLMNWGIGEKVRNISIPTLIVASEYDYTPISLKNTYVSKMPNARIEVIKNSRHGVTMDQPLEFNKVILKFMNS